MSDIAEAASVLLARGRGSAELYAVRRSPTLRFFGGFVAFPGGRVSVDDAAPDPRRAAAVRELFEETGVLLARRPDGSFPPSGPDLDALRRGLLAETASFDAGLAALRVRIVADDLRHAGRLVTPPFAPTRFDTAFFTADCPENQEPSIWPGELDDGFWTTADALLDRWTRGETFVSPASLGLLAALSGRPISELADRFPHVDDATIPPILLAPAVQQIPLRTVALPPLTHTNAFLIGVDRPVLLDPGSKDATEQERLFAAIDASGRRPVAVILSHHHPDHIGAASASAARYGVGVWAHRLTAEALGGRIAVERLLDDGDRVSLGTAPDGASDWHLVALHTPGHAPGHLAFFDPHYRILFAADMVSTLSSMVIAPPEGDLDAYLTSLRRLATLDTRLLLPAHGGPTVRAKHLLGEAESHRLKRQELLFATLTDEPQRPADLTALLYKGLAPALRRLAELQTLAGLVKLEREGRAARVGEGWQRTQRAGSV